MNTEKKKPLIIWIILDVLMIGMAIILGIFFYCDPAKGPDELEVKEENPKLVIPLDKKYQSHSQLVRTQYRITDGILYGTGENTSGQLGIGQLDALGVNYTEPIQIAENVVHVDSCQSTVIYLTEEHELWGMGDNFSGQLGVPIGEDERTGKKRYVTTPVLIAEEVKYAAVGGHNVIILKEDGSVYVLGSNENGQLGPTLDERKYLRDESEMIVSYSYEPILIMENAVYVESGLYTLSAIDDKGDLYMWGDNSFGEIGNGNRGEGLPTISTYYVSEPYLVKENIKDVRIDEFTVYATNYRDEVFAWGSRYDTIPKKIK